MTTYGFSAFLKLANLSSVRQRSAIRERVRGAKGSGYDFHKAMRGIAGRRILGEISLDEALELARAIVQEAERKSALAAIARLAAWRVRFDEETSSVESRTYESPRKAFKVRMDVDFGTTVRGDRVAIHLWNTKFPDLDGRLTRAALALFPSLYVGAGIDDFAVLSLRNGQLIRLSEDAEASVIAERMVDALEELFIEIRSGGDVRPGTEERPRP